MTRRLALLVSLVVVLPCAAGVLLGGSARPAPDRARTSEEFQELVGGLGLGTAVGLSPCAGAFDPRVETSCTLRHEPVPCGSPCCPAHAPLRSADTE